MRLMSGSMRMQNRSGLRVDKGNNVDVKRAAIPSISLTKNLIDTNGTK